MQKEVKYCCYLNPLCRSTFPGAGRYAAHWTGDNAATWSSLHFSIAGMINSNFWGISMAGADICGFFDIDEGEIADGMRRAQSSEGSYSELCNRCGAASVCCLSGAACAQNVMSQCKGQVTEFMNTC
jgi:hypothetical protein